MMNETKSDILTTSISPFKKYLEDNNLTAYRISKDTGIPESTLSRWSRNEADIRNITGINLYTISNYLGMTMDNFFKQMTNIE